MEKTRHITRKRTLKDGSIKEYQYDVKYTTKTDTIKNCGKTAIYRRVSECRDKAKLERLLRSMDEIGM